MSSLSTATGIVFSHAQAPFLTVACHREGTTLLPHRWDHLGAHRAGQANMISLGGGAVNGGPLSGVIRVSGALGSQVPDVMGGAFRGL